MAFDVVGNTVRIRKVESRPGRGRGIVDRLRGRATTRLTTDREPHNGYLILQGGLPETDEFVSSHWK